MNKRVVLAVVVVGVCSVCSAGYFLYSVSDTGTWPKSWPVELEPLRTHSRTLEGPLGPDQHYAIRFTKREAFEAAWPHIVKLKSKGAPLLLKRGDNFFLGGDSKAGVVVHCPDRADAPGAATKGAPGRNATSLELVVDGEIVDLNRIPLPADTPIIDVRFRE